MNKQTGFLLIRAFILLLALLLLLVGYYWVHKPVDLALLARVGGAFLDVVTICVLFAAAHVIGRAAINRSALKRHPSDMSGYETAAITMLLGLTVISIFTLVMGLIGLLITPAIWVGLAAILVIYGRPKRRGAINERLTDVFSRFAITPSWRGILTFLSLIVLVPAALYAFAPPYAWDSLTYHLVAPMRYLAQGAITAQPDNFFLGFPQGIEILYTLAIGLFGRVSAAASLHFAFGVLGVLITMGVGRRVSNLTGGYRAAAILLSAFSLVKLFGWAYVDLAVLAYSAAVLSVILSWRRTHQRGWLVVAGILLAGAVAAKYIAGGWAIAIFVLVVVRSPRRDLIRNGAALVIPALIAFSPFALKGALLYQNPIYPYVFDGLNWDAARMAQFNGAGAGLIGMGSAWQLPMMPLAATILGDQYTPGYAFTSGAWLLTTPLLLIVIGRALKRRGRVFAADGIVLAVVVLIFWAMLSAFNGIAAQTRMMAMAFPLAAALGGLALTTIDDLPRKPIYVGFIVRALFVITFALHSFDVIRDVVQDQVVPYTLGMISEDDYLSGKLGAHYPALRQLASLPEGSHVRLMFEPRSLYCPASVTCHPDVMFDYWRRPLRLGATPDQVFEAYRADGDDYWLVWMDTDPTVAASGFDFDRADPAHTAADDLFPVALQTHMIAVWTDGLFYTLYTWR